MLKRILFVFGFTTLVFAHPEDAPLCPDYGVGRIGSMTPDGYGVKAYGDFLYWTAQMDGLDLALELTPFVNNTNNSKVIRQGFQWDPAFRVGLGYYVKWSDWDFNLEWTRFRTTSTAVASAGDNTLYPLWGRVGNSSTRQLSNISGHWDLHYDTLDLLFHPGFFRYQYFSIQPTFGLRGVWIDWDYTINQMFLETDGSFVTQNLPYENHYHAIGFVVGVNTKWFVAWGLHLYANAQASVLYGKYDLEQPSEVASAQVTLDTSSHQDYWRVRSNIHLMMGFAWEKLFANNTIRLNIHAGYEFLTWFNQNQLYRSRSEIFGATNLIEFTPVIERDDLGINGLTVGASLEF